MQNESVSLAYRATGSDKVYHVQLEAKGQGYVVNTQHGRRGSALVFGTKTAEPVSYDKAKKVFDAVIREKTGKGYSTGDAGTPFAGTEDAGRVSSVQPQLSNPISEAEALALLHDPAWGLQEKADGERRPVRVGHDGAIGINKKGLTVPLPTTTIAGVAALGLADGETILDAELIGDVLHVFDALTAEGVDLRTKPFSVRAGILSTLKTNDTVRAMAVARTSEEKLALFERLRNEGREGVVFNRLDAPYSSGRPSSGGPSLKFKFVAEATVRVARVNDGKRSVVMEVHDDFGDWREVGSVTVPPGVEIPSSGDIIEVRYLYAYEGGSLFQPTLKSARTDQDESDCLVSQLKFKPSLISQ